MSTYSKSDPSGTEIPHTPSLDSLPDEIIDLILRAVPPRTLVCRVELTCRKLRDITAGVYKQYATGSADSLPQNHRDWKELAVEFQDQQKKDEAERSKLVDIFLQTYSNKPDCDLHPLAESISCWLHDQPLPDTDSLYALLAALFVQQRHDKAHSLFAEYRASDLIRKDATALLQARFDLDLGVSFEDISLRSLFHCSIACATGGSVSQLDAIRRVGLEDDMLHFVAVTAAEFGRVEILQALSDILRALHPLDLTGSKLSVERLVLVAWKSDAVDAVDAGNYLLWLKDDLDLSLLWFFALDSGRIGLLELLKRRSANLAKAHLPDGVLQITYILRRTALTWETRRAIIRFLVEDPSFDINATDQSSGLTAVHVAALDGGKQALSLLQELGADMMSHGDVEQCAAELIFCSGGDIKSIPRPEFPQDLLSEKRRLAEEILSSTDPSSPLRKVPRLKEPYSKYGPLSPLPQIHSLERCSGSLAEIETKHILDRWVKRIGLQVLKDIRGLLNDPKFKSIEKFWNAVLTRPSPPQMAIQERHVGLDCLLRLLQRYVVSVDLEDLSVLVSDTLSQQDVDHLERFVDSPTGCAFQKTIWEVYMTGFLWCYTRYLDR